MGRRYFPWLMCLAGLFAMRVLAQLLQALHPVRFLPPFESWHGAVLPYPGLVAAQIAVIVALVVVAWRVRSDGFRPAPWKHRFCFVGGSVYFAFMTFRFAAGLTFLSEHAWFARSLPAFFHIVLATYILTVGHYLYRRNRGSKAEPRGS